MRLRAVPSIRLRHRVASAPLHEPVLRRPALATPLRGRLPPSRLSPFFLRPSSHPLFHLRRLQLPSLTAPAFPLLAAAVSASLPLAGQLLLAAAASSSRLLPHHSPPPPLCRSLPLLSFGHCPRPIPACARA